MRRDIRRSKIRVKYTDVQFNYQITDSLYYILGIIDRTNDKHSLLLISDLIDWLEEEEYDIKKVTYPDRDEGFGILRPSIWKNEVLGEILTSDNLYSFDLLCCFMTALPSNEAMSAILKASSTIKEYISVVKHLRYSELERQVFSITLLDAAREIGFTSVIDKVCINAVYKAIAIKLHLL